jgi:DNA-binding SARP family transcriptional activator/pimeloyl-ACP methyl ester carboxylesterase
MNGSYSSVALFGHFSLTIGGRSFCDLDLPTKCGLLVKVLALHVTHELSQERVSRMLWPESGQDACKANLYKALHQLRTKTGCDEIVAAAGGRVALGSNVSVDVDQFRHVYARAAKSSSTKAWERAVSAWKGPLLIDDLYDDAIGPERAALERDAREATLTLAERYVEAQDRRAEALLHCALDRDRLDERAHRALIRLFLAFADPDRARAQYDCCTAALQSDLGVGPEPATRRLATALDARVRLSDAHIATPLLHAMTPSHQRIAYQVIGDGPVLVHMSQLSWNDLRLEWDIPHWREFHLGLARGRRLVRYDSRGMGQSQREVPDTIAIADVVEDLVTVADAASLDEFDVFSGVHSSLAAIKFAAEHPGRVRRLVLWQPYAKGADYAALPGVVAGCTAMHEDWGAFCRSIASISLGPDSAHDPDPVADMMIRSGSAATIAAQMRGYWTDDVEDLVPRIEIPVLVLCGNYRWFPFAEQTARVIAGLQRPHVVQVERAEFLPWASDTARILQAIDDFLGA